MGMWVVSNAETGYSDESMRFAVLRDAQLWVYDHTHDSTGEPNGAVFEKRWESDDPHPQNQHALGQIWHDGRWVDFARDTPEVAIRWAEREPVGLARVVDWISREVMWP